MRQKRAKAYKRQVLTLVHTFKFREPFQVLVDDEIVTTCVLSSYDLIKGLRRTLQAEVKPMITQCCIQALYKEGNQKIIEVAKQFERRRCNHSQKEPLSPDDCIESITEKDGKNQFRYVIASQNIGLRRRLRSLPGTPLIYMNRSVMVMEPLSLATVKYSEDFEKNKLTKGLNDSKVAGLADDNIDSPEAHEKVYKKKGPKGPNPLSVKKKTAPSDSNDSKPKRRKRHHKSGEKDAEVTSTDPEIA